MLRSSSTRYLSAGAYLDPDFRNAVLHELLGRRDRAVAPSFSADAAPVVRHALNARRHQIVRDLVLTAILLVFLVVEGKLLLAVAALLCAVLLAYRSLRALLRLHVAGALALLVPAVITLVVAALLFESSSQGLFSFGGSDPYATPPTFTTFVARVIGVMVVVLGAAWTAVAVERLVNHQTIVDHLLPPTFSPAGSPTGPKRYQARLRYIDQAQTGNVTYYPHDASEKPFIGSGTPLHTWTRAVPLVTTEDAGAPSLTTQSIQDTLSIALVRMDGVGEVSVQERLVTQTSQRSGDPRTDPATGLPRPRMSPAEMELLESTDATGTHRYLCVRAAPGQGDYEIWVFVRCQVQGQTLHLDLIGCSTPPIRARYREIDQYTAPDLDVVRRTALATLPGLLGLLLRAPLRLLLTATRQDQGAGNLRTRLRRMADESSTDRGARTGVRELGTDLESQDFQAGLAIQRHVRMIEQQILETITVSMEQAGFSTGEFRRRTQIILDGPAQ
ncbi:hypothetical protein GCM10022223_62700 [Kineosporia mesophila]|uniref:Uncharacterized protein n=1 Tax=Kineosporia mesophila TaxID=566012 RepID=A0ABP7AMP6_9ACTN|nr:hypothetical protein [Kineosporia mesophila]MCD5354536.1 hypothetical protein [Kineosporia mesophila]